MRKLNILITTIILAMALIMPMVFATVTLTKPVASGNYTGTVNVTVTVTDAGGVPGGGITNVSCYYNSSGGATAYTGAARLVEILNTSAAQAIFTSSPSITSLTATTTYNISCLALNSSSQINQSVSAASITFDSTNPTCSIRIKSPRIAYKGIQDVIWESADGLSLISTAVTIDRPQSGADMSYTDVSRTLTLLSTDTNYLGDWNTTVLATDRPGNTCSASTTFKSYLPDGDIEEAYEQEEASKFNLKGLLIVIGIGAGLYFLFKDK